MPLVRLEIRRGRSSAEKKAMLDAIHRAMVEAIRIPESDRTLRVQEYDPDDFQYGTRDIDPVLVEITLFSGRSVEAKRRLYQGIVSNLGELGIPAESVLIVLIESAEENWGVRGGQMAADIDLGFQIKV